MKKHSKSQSNSENMHVLDMEKLDTYLPVQCLRLIGGKLN